MTSLIVESTGWTPHVETGLEIALLARARGESVHYINVRGLGGFAEDRPFKARRWYHRRDGSRLINRRAALVLQQHGVQVHLPQVQESDREVPHFASLEALKAHTEDGWDIGMGVASSLISWSKCAQADPVQHRDSVVRMIRAGRLIYRNVLQLYAALRPDEVVLFNGRFASTRPTLRAVQAAGGRWRVHERGCDPDHYFFYDFMPHDMTRWSAQIFHESQQQSPEILEQGAEQFYGRRRAGGAKEWHSYCNWELGDLGPHAALREQRPVVYFSSSDDEFAAIGEVLEQAMYPQQIEALRFLAEQCRHLGQKLVVRLHPHLAQKDPTDLRSWHENLRGLATIIDAHEKVDSYALMDAASVCVSYGSTAGIEATYWGKPHLLLGRAIYESLPGVDWVRDPNALAALLKTPPTVNRDGAIRYGWYMETFGETFRYFEPKGLFGGTFLRNKMGRRPG